MAQNPAQGGCRLGTPAARPFQCPRGFEKFQNSEMAAVWQWVLKLILGNAAFLKRVFPGRFMGTSLGGWRTEAKVAGGDVAQDDSRP
jgi:hypothetical protein